MLLKALFLLLATNLAFADNGNGYNGPLMEGVSIPVESDRDYSKEELQKTLKTCLMNGDNKIGLVSLSQRIFEIFSTHEYSFPEVKKDESDFLTGMAFSEKQNFFSMRLVKTSITDKILQDLREKCRQNLVPCKNSEII